MGKRSHHNAYVVELSKDVLREAKFIRCNPGYVDGRPCVYVGMSGLDPDVRFDKLKAGIQYYLPQKSVDRRVTLVGTPTRVDS